MKTILKILIGKIVLVLIGLVLWQCQTDKLDKVVNEEKINYEINSLKLNEIPGVVNHLNRTLQRDVKLKSSTTEKIIFDIENVMEVLDTLQNSNYSINFSIIDAPINTFYNLVIEKDSIGNLSTPFVLRYVIDDDSYSEFIENYYDINYFKGKIYHHKYTDFFSYGTFYKKNPPCSPVGDANGDPIPCNEVVAAGGYSGGANASGNPKAGTRFGGWGYGGTGGSNISITYENCHCHSRHNPNGCTHPIMVVQIGNMRIGQDTKSSDDDCPSCVVSTRGGVGLNTGMTARIKSFVEKLENEIELTTIQKNFLNRPPNWRNTEAIIKYWRESDKGNETQNFITHALKALMDGGEVDFEELYINIEIFDDEYEETGQTSLIPNPLNLDNGDSVYLSFGTTKDGVNANQEVEQHLIDGLKFALNQANNNLTNKITDIYIMATTNGGHSSTSNHSKGSAIDISRINGQKMFTSGTTEQIVQLQIAFDNYQHIRENFGPYFKHKYSVETNTWDYNYPVGGHKDHIHISTRTNQ